MDNVFMDGLMQQPTWLKIWVGWMIVVNTASLAFLKHTEARVVLGVWIANGITMTLLAEAMGYTRLLGLSHVIWWTPLIVYLWTRRDRFDPKALFTRWVYVLILTNTISLVVDYIDVIRYILGDRGSQA